MKRQVPKMTTDEEAEALLASDLSNLDFSQFKPTRFRFTDKPARQEKCTPTEKTPRTRDK
jgi:predicted DNA binding CopG/RHH family protein